MEMYTDERIAKETFAQGKVVDNLLKQMEDLFSEHFGEDIGLRTCADPIRTR